MLKMVKSLALMLVIMTLSLNFLNSSIAASKPTNDTKIIVYYFYAKPRCISCKKIENYTKEAVEALKNNKVEYKAINLDDNANNHYAKEYKLFTKAVILSKVKNGKQVKWKNLDGIWTKLNNEKEFKSYVTKEIKNIGG